MSCVSHAFAAIHCRLVATCWKRDNLLTLVGDVYLIFITFPCGIMGQVGYLIVCLYIALKTIQVDSGIKLANNYDKAPSISSHMFPWQQIYLINCQNFYSMVSRCQIMQS